MRNCLDSINPFQPSVAFHMETSYLICTANQMTGFHMKCNTGLKLVKRHWSGCSKIKQILYLTPKTSWCNFSNLI